LDTFKLSFKVLINYKIEPFQGSKIYSFFQPPVSPEAIQIKAWKALTLLRVKYE